VHTLLGVQLARECVVCTRCNVSRNELNCECFNVTLAREKKTYLPEDDLGIETRRSNFKCFYVKLYMCICLLIIKMSQNVW